MQVIENCRGCPSAPGPDVYHVRAQGRHEGGTPMAEGVGADPHGVEANGWGKLLKSVIEPSIGDWIKSPRSRDAEDEIRFPRALNPGKF